VTAPLSPQTAQIQLLRVLYEVAATPETELNTVLRQVAQSLAEALNVEAVSIQLYDAKRNVARIAVEYPLNTVEGFNLPGLDNPVTATFVNTPQPKPFVLNDVNELPEGPVKEAVRQARVKSALIVPMFAQRTRVGSIALATRTAPRTFAPQEIEIIQAIIGQLAVSIYSAQLLAEVEFLTALGRDLPRLGNGDLSAAPPSDLADFYASLRES